MVDYNGGALSEEEYVFQSRGMIIRLYALSRRLILTELVVKTGRILAKFLLTATKLRSIKSIKDKG